MNYRTIVAPRVNANDDQVRLVSWRHRKWERVSAGDVIADIETSKAVVEIESDCDGLLVPMAEVGSSVNVGAPIALVLAEQDDNLAENLRAELSKEIASSGGRADGRLVSGKARKLLEQYGLLESDIPGTGPVRESDILALVARSVSEAASNDEQRRIVERLRPQEGDILLYGAGLQAEVVLDCLAAVKDRRVIVGVDDNLTTATVSGIPVVSPSLLGEIRKRGVELAHVCIWNPRAKQACARKLMEQSFSLTNVVHPSAVISKTANIGEGVFIGPLVLIGPLASIGDYALINNAASVAHHAVVGRGARISDGARIAGNVTIGEGALIGLGSTVNSGLSIGDNATVVSGACVYDNVAAGGVVRAGDFSRIAKPPVGRNT